MKFLPLILLLAFFTAFPAYAVQRNLEITWDLPSQTNIAPVGYRLYLKGHNEPVCSTKDGQASSMRCAIDITGNSSVFTLTSYAATGKESQHSAPFTYTFQELPLTAIFSSTPSSGQAPLKTTFDATASTGNVASYVWDFGDGSQAKGQQVDHVYAKTGKFTAKLTISDNKGVKAIKTTQITVTKASGNNHAPQAAIGVDPGNGTSPLTVRFDASGSSDPDGDQLTYSWNFGDGSKGSGKTTSHIYTEQGTVYATLTVTDSHDASSTARVPIMVLPSQPDHQGPKAIISMIPAYMIVANTPCHMSGVHSTPSTEGKSITSYRWNFGDGFTGSGETVSHTYSTPGNYSVTLTVRDSSGKTGQSNCTVRIINNKDIHNVVFLQQIYLRLLFKKSTADTRQQTDDKAN